ncbi:DegV family protein with EDD domain [Sediminihabitans luteus]|uniref:DegV family protein with EDD domain n=1 Tax=Sediminihabitans luteus TaxID=1138585 RepID=A0A2M9CPT1_9CELL|nr:DegV family protein [Sediminihabitans luteus]PJJ73912.1 DegV family protein with EDD domain [Sediminihabitans luteus]GII98175.1 hypothetical protein Slu03_05530 [Sediminihabitans luteus]
MTDSTASLPAHLPDGIDPEGLRVVPLHVLVGEDSFLEGVEMSDEDLALRLRAGARVTTSQPSPAAFAAAYAAAARAGAGSVVSVHLSGALSGTVHAAALAASRAPVPVRVLDSRTVGMGLGFAALAAARAAQDGAPLEEVARRAIAVADSSRAVFMVESLDHLRRGGRLSATAAAIGTALGVRPLLSVRDGSIVVVQKVRTRVAAVDRMIDVAVEAAGRRRSPVLAVHHLGDPGLAEDVAWRLRSRVDVPTLTSPVSAVVGAHVGEGVLAVIVADDDAGR